MIFNNKV